MNGRAYDYNLGRFLSVDPVIQSPGNSQSLNPYSYIMNNPLAGTDPTGYMGCAASKIDTVCANTDANHGGFGQPGEALSGKVSASVKKEGSTLKIHLTGGNGADQRNVVNALQNNTFTDAMAQIKRAAESPSSGIAAPLEGSALKGMGYFIVRGLTLGIVFGDISSSSWLNADPQQSADLEAYESEAGLSKHAMGILPGNMVSKAVPLIRTAVTKNADGVFQFGDDLVKEIAQQQYSAGFNHLKQFMSPKEIKAYLADPSVASMITGHAVHRATDAVLQRMHPGRFDYNATRAFDFLDRSTGQAIELTTKKGVRTHQNRAADIVTYD
jgi:hypothetical protein